MVDHTGKKNASEIYSVAKRAFEEKNWLKKNDACYLLVLGK